MNTCVSKGFSLLVIVFLELGFTEDGILGLFSGILWKLLTIHVLGEQSFKYNKSFFVRFFRDFIPYLCRY